MKGLAWASNDDNDEEMPGVNEPERVETPKFVPSEGGTGSQADAEPLMPTNGAGTRNGVIPEAAVHGSQSGETPGSSLPHAPGPSKVDTVAEPKVEESDPQMTKKRPAAAKQKIEECMQKNHLMLQSPDKKKTRKEENEEKSSGPCWILFKNEKVPVRMDRLSFLQEVKIENGVPFSYVMAPEDDEISQETLSLPGEGAEECEEAEGSEVAHETLPGGVAEEEKIETGKELEQQKEGPATAAAQQAYPKTAAEMELEKTIAAEAMAQKEQAKGSAGGVAESAHRVEQAQATEVLEQPPFEEMEGHAEAALPACQNVQPSVKQEKEGPAEGEAGPAEAPAQPAAEGAQQVCLNNAAHEQALEVQRPAIQDPAAAPGPDNAPGGVGEVGRLGYRQRKLREGKEALSKQLPPLRIPADFPGTSAAQ